jgi:ATP-dependent DNA helicase RecG
LRGTDLSEFLLKKHDLNWDEFIEDGATFEDIRIGSIEKFKEDAIDRIPAITKEKNEKVILEKLNLMKKNKLKRVAIMLFGENPQYFHTSAYLRIGKFLTDTDILTTDIVKGNLFEQLETTLEILRTKYLLSYIKFEGIHRREILEYPYEALREVILNALIHRNYLGTSNIQIRVYDDRIIFMNEGKLPPEVPIEKLKTNHLSKPGNPLVADVFYKARFIESWGRGTLKIVEKCLEQGLPDPNFAEDHGVFTVTLYKTELKEKTSEESVKDTVKEIMALISENPSISMSELAKNTGLSVKGVEWNIKRLRDSGILRRVGSPRSGHWEAVTKKSGKEKVNQ